MEISSFLWLRTILSQALSSKKVLYRYFESLVGGDVNIDELIGFYRKLSKITDKLSPEDCLELFKLERG